MALSVTSAVAVAVAGAVLAPAVGHTAVHRTHQHGHRAQTVTRAAHWTTRATVDRRPLTRPERPDASATATTMRRGCVARAPQPRRAVAGEGILRLTLSAPGTSWASSADTAVTVDATVDHKRSQQIVLFDGAQPFTYEAYLGHLVTGRHCLALTVDDGLSHDAATPRVKVYAAALRVVPSTSPDYQLITHAPLMYGRSTSAERNAQLLTYGQATRDGRDTDLSYTVIWTREDVGDGIIPAYEWGLFGRMTDIETVLKERITRSGAIRSAQYLSCGCEKFPMYPDQTPAPPVDSEEDLPYPTHGTPAPLAHHLALRDATGNNDTSPSGTTSYRMQQVPVAGPSPDQSREVAMDEHPWTYRLSNQELTRSTPQASDPKSLLAGNYPQYLVVDINANATGTSSIAVEVRLRGDPTWYSNDYAQTTAPGPPTTYPFYDGGHARTVIKLPPGWHGTPIRSLRLRLNAPAGGPTPKLRGKPRIQLIEVTPGYHVRHVAAPALTVVTGTQLSPGVPG